MKKVINTKRFRKQLHFFVKALGLQIAHNNTFMLAKGLAFSFLICMVPMVLILFSATGYVLDSQTIEAKLHTFLMQMIPYPDSVYYIEAFLIRRINEFTMHKTIAAYIGGIGLFWAASGLFANMRNVLNRIFKRKSKRHFVFGKLKDFMMIFFVLIFFLFSMWVIPFVELIGNFADSITFLQEIRLDFLHQLFLQLLSFGLIYMIVFLLFYFIPSGRMLKRIAGISAFSTTFLGMLAQKFFLIYVNHSSGISRIYGAYMLLVLVLFWFYYSSVVFIIGAEIGQIFQKALVIKRTFMVNLKSGEATHKGQDEISEGGL